MRQFSTRRDGHGQNISIWDTEHIVAPEHIEAVIDSRRRGNGSRCSKLSGKQLQPRVQSPFRYAGTYDGYHDFYLVVGDSCIHCSRVVVTNVTDLATSLEIGNHFCFPSWPKGLKIELGARVTLEAIIGCYNRKGDLDFCLAQPSKIVVESGMA